MTPLFLLFKNQFGILKGAGLLGLLCIVIALIGILYMEETFGKDLNFLEEKKIDPAQSGAKLKLATQEASLSQVK